MSEKLSVCQVKLKPIPASPNGELSDKVYRKCCFCEKNCETSSSHPLIDKLSGPGNYFCAFCLRHNLHTAANRDVLILSFRSIIGYFYFQNYVNTTSGRKLWLAEIEDYIESHVEAGLVNPLFLYDPETMLWFVNFAKIGTSKKKAPLDEVHKTILSILTCFNLNDTVPGISMSSLYVKYKDAIDNFYRKRYRPADRRMLIPTLANTGVVEPKTCTLDRTRSFIAEDLRAKR